MLAAVGSAAAATRRGIPTRVITSAPFSAKLQSPRGISVSVIEQPNAYLHTDRKATSSCTCGADGIHVWALRPQQLQASAYVTLNSSGGTVSSPQRRFSSNSWNWSSGDNKTSPSSSASSFSGAQAAGQSTADGATDGHTDVDTKIQREVLDRCEALHASLMPLNEKVSGPS